MLLSDEERSTLRLQEGVTKYDAETLIKWLIDTDTIIGAVDQIGSLAASERNHRLGSHLPRYIVDTEDQDYIDEELKDDLNAMPYK